MGRISRDRLVIGLVGLTAVVVGCSRLTAVDWGLVPLASAGTSTGASDAGGAAAGETSGGVAGEPGLGAAGEAGDAAGGEAGAVSGGGTSAGTGGTAAGTAGMSGGAGRGGNAGASGSGGASGGMGGSAGSAGSTTVGGAPPCTGAPGPLGNAMVLFAGPAKPTAARGGRVGLDADCEAERTKLGLTQSKAHAFISVSTNDFIANFKTQYPDLPVNQRIVGPTGIQIAASWNALLTASFDNSLICSHVLPADAFWWLSGSNYIGLSDPPGAPPIYGQYGGDDSQTCNGWTLGTHDPLVAARPGSAEYADARLLAAATAATVSFLYVSCDSTSQDPILCLAYSP